VGFGVIWLVKGIRILIRRAAARKARPR